MMADHSSSRRRRSPESSVGGRRKERDKESRRAPSEIVYEESQRTTRPGPSSSIPADRGMHQAYGANTTYLSSSASSSSSYELIDISRSYPANRSGIATFFTAPSEHRARKLRKRKSNRLFKLNNSSSSSVNSDLAYGNGYIRRPKLRRVRSRSGKEIDREGVRYPDRERERQRYGESSRHSGSERHGNLSGSERRGYGSGSERKRNTNAEILAVGAGLAALARDQNKHDLKNRNGRSPQVGTGGASSRYGGGGAYSGSRGLAPSKVSHESDTYDEDGWESASDAESENSVDSRLAFGAEASGWWGKELHRPLSRKNTIVDPRLFGPENSLQGFVDQPVGFGNVTWTSTEDFGQQHRTQSTSVVQNESFSGSQASLQQVFPVQNSRDPTRFDAARNSAASGSEPYMSSGRAGPTPLQHPQPYTPVSQSVYEPSHSAVSENSGRLKRAASSPGKGTSVAQAALVGVAGAAVGAAIASARSDDRKERTRDSDREDYFKVSPKQRDDERNDDSRIGSRRRDEDYDNDSRISSKRREDNRDDVSRISSKRWDDDGEDSSRVSLKRRESDKKGSKDERRKDKRDSPDRGDRKDKRRDKDRKKDGSRYSDEERREKKREKRRDDARDDQREKHREKDDRRGERSEVAVRPELRYEDRRSKSEAAISTVSTIDPFMFQVDDNAFPTPVNQYTEGHGRHDSVPKVVTVERVPDFTRERSSSIKDRQPNSMTEYGGEYSQYDERDRYRNAVSDHGLHNAEVAYGEAHHSTAPIAAAAIGAAAAVVGAEIYRESRSEKRRNERRSGNVSDYDDREHRGREPTQVPIKERDPIQEEADRAYREIVMARKIASQVIRSRSNSPDGSVVSKYSHQDEPEEVKIVTPPEMDHPKIKGPYDAPNADFNPDYHFDDPRELRTFKPQTPVINQGYRDPDALEPRPLLNLVRPTPVPSPIPESQAPREDSSRSEPTRTESSHSTPTRPASSREEPQSEPSRPSTRSESGRPERPTRSSRSSDNGERPRTSISDVGKITGMDSPTASVVSKGVTWGENETKHYDVESPSDHRDEYISSSDVPTYEKSPRPDHKPDTKPSRGWGAIAAGVLGAGAGVAAATVGDTVSSKNSKGKEHEIEKSSPNAYKYRGVVVEPESPQTKGRKRTPSPPSPGPKPTVQSGHIPGAFDDDLEFTANVAAGLKDAGFNSDIVIDDPNFRRRTSPPGSNERLYQAPFVESVSDLSQIPAAGSGLSGSGFVTGEAATTPQEWRGNSPEGDEPPTKLSKKEQKKRDKAKRQSAEFSVPIEEPTPTPKEDEQDFYFSEPKLSKKEQKKREKEAKRQSSVTEDIMPSFEPVVDREVVDEPESYFVETPKKKKKSKRGSATFGEQPEVASPGASSVSRTVSVPVDAFDDLQNHGDEWSESKKPKAKSKRDSERYDSPSRSGVAEPSYPAAISLPQSEVSESSSSTRKKDKSRGYDDYELDPAEISLPRSEISERSSGKRREKSTSYDEYENDPAAVSLPPSTPSEISQDKDYDEARKSRKSSLRDSGILDARDRSVASEAASRYDDEPKKKKKSHRSSTRDTDDFDDTRSVFSVASAPAGDEDGRKSKKKEKKSGGFFGLFGSKSEVGTQEESPKGSKDDFEDAKSKKKKKRYSMPDYSSLDGALGSQSVGDLTRSASNGHSSSSRYDNDDGARSDGERKKSRSRGNSTSSKKESFLGNPGTLGARVGIAGAAGALAVLQNSQYNADDAHEEALHQDLSDRTEQQLERDTQFDPEIARRDFRPSIDPQYGDLLPLPPSEPATPGSEELEELPGLPESRPDTPEDERLGRERLKSSTRKIYETPAKSPSQSAIPINFRMGRGKNSAPPSPGFPRSTPLQSPQTPSTETFGFSRGSRNRPTSWESAKEYRPLYLPESIRRGSTTKVSEEEEPLPELPESMATSRSSSLLDFDDARKDFFPSDSLERQDLAINTGIASYEQSGLLDSQQSTPKAKTVFHDDEKSVPSSKDYTRDLAAGAIAGAALAGTAAYLASSHHDAETFELEHQPSPIDPMSKDRSSYLLQSSPMSKKVDGTIDGTDSPTYRKPYSLDDIQEGDRERALKALSGEAPIAKTDPEEFSFGKSKKDKKVQNIKELSRSSMGENLSLAEPALEAAHKEAAQLVAEPEEEFSMAKSKKDKKKGKHSRPFTQDDISLAESAVEAVHEVPLDASPEPEDEFSMPKSKKDKKKDKKKSKSIASWDIEEAATPSTPATEEPITETSKDVSEPPFTSLDPVEVVDDFSTPSKKTKKDKKGKFKAPVFELEPEPETDVFEMAPEAPTDPGDEGIADASARLAESHSFDDFSTPSKKGKMSKKGKPKLTGDEPSEQKFEESVLESDQTREVAEDLEGLTTKPIHEVEAEFSTPKSKRDKKKDKKAKSKSNWDDPEEAPTPISDEILPHSTRELSEDASAPLEFEAAEDSFSFRTKKDKKKDKKKGKSINTFSEPTPEATSEPVPDDPHPAFTPAVEETDNLFALEDKKDKKKKDKKKSKGAPGIPTTRTLTKEDPPNFDPESTEDSFHDFPEETTTPSNVPATTSASQDVSTSLDFTEAPFNTAPDDIAIPDEFSLQDFEKGKGKKNKSAAKFEDSGEPAPISPPEVAGDIPDFLIPESKKGKKKGKKSKSWDVEPEAPELVHNAERSVEPDHQTLEGLNEDAFDFANTTSKKGKKKGKKVESWDAEPETRLNPPEAVQLTEIESLEVAPALDSFDDFAEPSGKKGKKKGKKTQFGNLEPETPEVMPYEERSIDTENLEAAPPQDTFDDFAMPPSKKSKKNKKGKSQILDTEEVPATPQDLATPEVPSVKPTPMVGPGGWIETPATPIATYGDGPSGVFKDTQGKDYFSSAIPLGAAVTAGAALLESNGEAKDASAKGSPLDEYPSRPTPDGFAAGYKEDQLSLAKQMQEEFAQKASKKNKKKNRQSLPATPEVEIARSRTFDAEDVQPRARSLSVGPPADIETPTFYSNEQLELAPQMNEDFAKASSKKTKKGKKTREDTWDDSIPYQPSDYFVAKDPEVVEDAPKPETAGKVPDGLAAGYKEDQLELARQLKGEFEKSSSKKSKKDKKKNRQDTWDDATPEAIPVENLTFDTEAVSTPDPADGASKRDGFEAGYQEDQLSLARQLQAEFGKKVSKKDKKRRSTSQTPREEEAEGDYFVEPEPFSADSQANPAVPAESELLEGETTRDGLAAGYKEDQLELARQLKEEFGSSSSKKGKKDKKGKKSKGANEEWDTLQNPVDEPSPVTEQPDLAVNEFAFTSGKKSKKEKKNKKGDSIAQSASDDVPSMESQDPIDGTALQTKLEVIREPPLTGDPDDEYLFTTKSSTKDKKGKKRQSLLRSNADDNLESRDPNTPTVFGESLTGDPENLDAEPKDDFWKSSSKKSKKDKKGKTRDSTVPSTPVEELPDELSASQDFGADLSKATDVVEEQTATTSVGLADATGEEESAFTTSKKSKKAKKQNRQSFAAEDVTLGSVVEPETPSAPTDDLSSRIVLAESSNPDTTVEDFGFSAKKSKRDLKKRGGLIRDSSTYDDLIDEPTETPNVQLETPIAPEQVDAAEPDDTFGFSSKKSKKDKKKTRQSMPESFTPEETLTEESALMDAAQLELSEATAIEERKGLDTAARDLPLDEQTTEATPPAEDGWGSFETKKSKKTKKKNPKDSFKPEPEELSNSLTSLDPQSEPTNTAVEALLPAETLDLSSPEESRAAATALNADSTELWDSLPSAKKSKKDKKKNKNKDLPTDSGEASGISTPLENTLEAKLDVLGHNDNPLPLLESARDPFIPATVSAFVDDTPREVSEVQVDDGPAVYEKETGLLVVKEEGEHDEDYSFSAEPSKREKKGKSGRLTPIESFPDEMMPMEKIKNVSDPIPATEPVEESTQDEWTSLSAKPSKKEKKKRKSVVATLMEFEPDQPSPAEERHAIEEQVTTVPSVKLQTSQDLSPSAEPNAVEAGYDDWASTSKKSKKDRKKGKSKVFDPITTPPEPISDDSPNFMPIVSPQNFGKPIELDDPEPVEEEWDSFSSKKSKKDKKKSSIVATPIEAIPDSGKVFDELAPEADSSTPKTPQYVTEEPADEDWDSLSTKKSKKDKKKGKLGTGISFESKHEPTQPFDERAPLEEPITVFDTTELVEETAGDEWGSFSTKKPRKDKRKAKLGVSTLEATSTPVTGETAPPFEPTPNEKDLSVIAPVTDGPSTTLPEKPTGDQIDFTFTEMSQKTNKNRESGPTIPLENPSEHSGSAKEHHDDSATIISKDELEKSETPQAAAIEVPRGDEWSITPKKSKKDNKKGISTTTFDEAAEQSLQETTTPAIKEPENIHASELTVLEEPLPSQVEDEWATSGKKSKKDKKNRKSGAATTYDEIPQHSTSAQQLFEEAPLLEPLREIVEEPQLAVTEEPTSAAANGDSPATLPKKSQKGKKNRKSDVPTTFDEIFEPSSRSTEDVPAFAPDLQAEERATLAEESIKLSEEPDDDEFGSFSTSKKSKKEKKKNKSRISTPKDETPEPLPVNPAEQDISIPFEEKSVDAPYELTQPSIEDEWATSGKKSKKDKKKNKTGLSTPRDEVPESTRAPSEANFSPAIVEGIPDQSLEIAESAADDEWATPGKKSKKDKKNSLGFPAREKEFSDQTPAPVEPDISSTTVGETADKSLEITEPTADDEWGSFTTGKKSKKDRKKKNFGTLMSENDTSGPALASSEQDTPLAVVEKTLDPAEPPAEEWDSFTTSKKLKSDKKNKLDADTPVKEPIPEIDTSFDDSTKQEIVDEPFKLEEIDSREVVEEPVNEWSLLSKKSKKDKKQGKIDLPTPAEEIFFPASSEAAEDINAMEIIENPTRSEPTSTELDHLPDKSQLGEAFVASAGTTAAADVAHSEFTSAPFGFREKTEEPSNEWDSFSTKKTKKDKKRNKFGDSTLTEEVFRPSSTDEEHAKPVIVDEPLPIEDVFSSEDIIERVVKDNTPAEPEEEFFVKRSKKDKKDKGRKTTSAEEPEPVQELVTTLPSIEPTISRQITEPAVVADVPHEPIDEFDSFSVKKSKKDKRGKGKKNSIIEETQSFDKAIATPIEENVLPPSTEVPDAALARSTPQEVVDEFYSFATKKPKKDKKGKGKSKDVFEEPEQFLGTSPAQEVDELVKQDEPIVEGPIKELGDEWASGPVQKSKKDKKKTKSKDLSETFEEPVETEHPVTPAAEIVSKPAPVEEISEVVSEESPLDVEEFSTYSLKKSKKDKKKRKSGISTPAEEPTPIVEPVSQESHFQDVMPSVSREICDEPAEIEPFAPAEEATKEPVDDFSFISKKSKKDKKSKRASRVDSITDVSPGTITPAVLELDNAIYQDGQTPVSTQRAMEDAPLFEALNPAKLEEDDLFGSLSRTSSKKDKRKRQATVDPAMFDDPSVPTAPVTSWAEEVEEAEVERTLPVIEDIAKDESLSHIAKTTEASPVDDFVRPNKKGKKGKKTKSVDNSRMPVTFDASKVESVNEESSGGGAGVAAFVVGAALVGASAKAKGKEPEKPVEPVRKLSKKEKRKQSIDKRTPTNDIFDDDALWEGKDPKEFEEKESMESEVDEMDDDGVWSPPQQQDSFKTAETSFQEPHLSRESTMDRGGLSIMPMDRPISPPDDMDFSHTLLQETSSTSRGLPTQQHQSPISGTAGTDQDLLAESPLAQRNPYRNSGKFARTGFSDLPVLEEESPTLPKVKPDKEDANRDSAFVAGSPIPPHVAFADNHEYVRDSGVHLREYSPARAPISTSDAAISRLSWPSVDEELETVDLDKSMQHGPEKTPDKKDQRKSHRGEEFYKPKEEANRSFEVYKSKDKKNRGDEVYIPKGDPFTDFLSTHRAETSAHDAQYHDEPTSRNISLSQRVADDRHSKPHHSSTIHKHGEDKSHQYHEDARSSIDKLPSQRMKADKPVDLHRSQTIHRSGERPSSFHEDKITSRDLTPSKEKSTILTPSGSSRKPAEESLVKKRLQKFETPELHQSPSFKSESRSVKDRVQRLQSPDLRTPTISKGESYSELAHLRRPKAEQPKGISDNAIAAGAAIVGAAGLGLAATRQMSQENRPGSATSSRSISNINRLRTPNRPDSVNSNRTSTPPLRRSSDRKVSGDLRSLSQRSQVDLAKEAELAAITKTGSSAVNATNNNSTPTNPTANEGRVRAKDMADVYDGFGEGRMGSPRSPTRPHSMRRRQSMQVLDLESKVEQLAAENRMLIEAKAQAERSLQTTSNTSSSLIEKDAEIDSLKRTLEWLQTEVGRLTEVNDGLNSANVTLGNQSNQRYSQLESQHAQTQRELQEARDAHTHVSSGMEGTVLAQVQAATQEKDQVIAQLRAELEITKQKIREMQAQILLSKTSDIEFLTIRDEDYFDNACQQLCQHVQQWVLRFSKFSDMRACRLTSEINNDKTIDRLDNAILDGSDVDSYLTDRVKRRDVFMSMTMTMVWEFIFTRYLFGMDREQRQKLKSLEKLLSEVGPAAAVHQWRATTLTLLSKRDAFIEQREQDTQAVVHAILETLSEILPPPSHLEDQIESQLKRVMKAAVDLSIEMRTQRAEYMMLPPLQPEYDANGDLASKVSFNAALMNERSGDTLSNEDLENQKAVVRIVLFPLVVKKGNDHGEGDEEIVVCPAQVLVAKSKKSVRMISPGRNLSKASMQSSMPADYNENMDDV